MALDILDFLAVPHLLPIAGGGPTPSVVVPAITDDVIDLQYVGNDVVYFDHTSDDLIDL